MATDFTINDFPPEIIMQFLPDRQRETISKLRLVSQRFYEVFIADRYYKYYLLYPDKPNLYQRDLEEIGDEEGRWRRILELEKRRLANWRTGQITSVETVNLPSNLSPVEYGYLSMSTKFRWQGKTDERNENWMLCECKDWQIVLLNITSKPIMSVHDVSAFTTVPAEYAILLPGQVMITGIDEIHVFNVTKVGDKISLDHLFKFENIYLSKLLISGKSNVTDNYKNWYVMYKKYSTDGILSIWDLKGAVKQKSIDLVELISQKWAVDLNDAHLELKVFQAEFPNVLVVLSYYMKDDRNKVSAVALVNVEERRLVHWFGQLYNLYLKYCTFKGHTVCVKFKMPHSIGQSVIVHDVRKRPTLEAVQSAILFKIESENELCVFYKNTTMIILGEECGQLKNKIRIASFDGPEVLQREISLNFELEEDGLNFKLEEDGLKFEREEDGLDDEEDGLDDVEDMFICIIEPFFVVQHYNKHGPILRTFDKSGNAMFDWAQVLSGRGIVRKTEELRTVKVDFQSLSKCVIQNKKGDSLHICSF